MRRQARLSAGGALIVRSASALQVWLWLLIFIFQNEFRISRSIKPGYLDFDNLPETNFTCEGKVIGGYYADLETSCQMFHVCTVGQNEEPMDIKFLCLNGTVFDQETRVCERVDEVDCTKSEKFYSLNLELYGSTAPPTIQPDKHKSQAQSTEQTQQQTKRNQEKDPSIDEVNTTSHDKSQGHLTDPTDSTEDPIQDIKKDEHKPLANKTTPPPIQLSGNEELVGDYQDEDDDTDYNDYSQYETTTSTQLTTKSTATTITTTTTTTKRPSTTMATSTTSPYHPSSIPHLLSSPTPIISSLSPPSYSSSAPSVPSALSAPSALSGFSAPSGPSASVLSTVDPSLLSPQEFIYRHRGPGSEAISFQRQSFRPADGVYITHVPPQQYDHFPYESSRTAPRPTPQRPQPAPFVQRTQPAPFRPTTLDPRDQLLRPGPTSQSSERHETSVKQNKPPTYSQSLPQQHLSFNPFYFDRKRSDESVPEVESSLSARSVAPPSITKRPPIKLKSPPRVIVTASASVSDSNGKRLNYTVGNVVNAVKPIVPINYDDYKESDLIFDPFFLDVPKLQTRRKTRSNKNRNLSTTTVAAETVVHNIITLAPVTVRTTTTERTSSEGAVATTTTAWNPDDYVDDNYEAHAYMPPPLAVLVLYDPNKPKEKGRSKNELVHSKILTNLKLNTMIEQSNTTSASAVQTSSSQSAAAGSVPASPAASPPPAPPHAPLLEAPACAKQRPSDCQTRA